MAKRTCVIFNGYKDKDGYGITKSGKRAHRVAYEEAYGVYDKKLLVCHSCDTPSCINPKHLFLGTSKDNMQDKVKKGRHVPVRMFGEKNPMAKLTLKKVETIRNKYKRGVYTQQMLAKDFKVSQAVINSVLKGKTWNKSAL
jgi:hypothetical protein